MSSESENGLIVGSELRMRLTQQGEEGMDPSLGNNQVDDVDDDDDDEGEVVKKEVVQEQNYQWEDSERKRNLTPLPQMSNNTPRTPSPSPSSTIPLSGKRKKKPKEMHDEFYYQFKKRKNKPSVPNSSNHAASYQAGKATSSKHERNVINRRLSAFEAKTPTMIRAEQVQSSLGSEFPSFAKLLVRSHVASCFWMGLPLPFAKSHLPKKDTKFLLENESGEQFEMKFIAEKPGLSAGWRKFAVGHKLLEGDVLIFQLVEPSKFKVYIIRANDLNEVDGALSLLNLDAYTKQNDTDAVENDEIALKDKKRKRSRSLPLTVVEKKNKNTGLRKPVQKSIQSAKQVENDSEGVGSEVLVGPRLSSSAVRFRDVKSFEEFSIVVNGVCIDSELPDHIRANYYDLCCSKNAFIHARLLQGLNCSLVAGIICETVSIASAIKACNLTTSRDEFASWDKTLKSFELLGMNVGFLRARVRHLLNLVFESEGSLDARKYREAKTERVRAEDEIRNLEARLAELNEASEKFNADIEALKSKAESYELKFQEEVDAPW